MADTCAVRSCARIYKILHLLVCGYEGHSSLSFPSSVLYTPYPTVGRRVGVLWLGAFFVSLCIACGWAMMRNSPANL